MTIVDSLAAWVRQHTYKMKGAAEGFCGAFVLKIGMSTDYLQNSSSAFSAILVPKIRDTSLLLSSSFLKAIGP